MRTLDDISGSNIRLHLSWVAAVMSLLLAGAFYRSEARRLDSITSKPVRLPLPLSALPMTVGQWDGRDAPIPEAVRKAVANDDSVSRFYVNRSSGEWAQLYITFSSRPRTMIGHKPSVCYVAAGWVWDGSDLSTIISRNGRKIPCLIHRFHQTDSARSEIVVLNFYVINGQISCDESVFSGIGWRTPNIRGDSANYVAQVQISSTLEAFVLSAGADLAATLIDFFPEAQ